MSRAHLHATDTRRDHQIERMKLVVGRRRVSVSGLLGGRSEPNDPAHARTEQLQAEGSDQTEGLEMVEEKARFELGMVKPDEIYVQVATKR